MSSKQEEHIEITQEISDLAFRFTDIIFGDDVERFWDCISAVDQSRAFGIYATLLEKENKDENDFSFSDFVKQNYMDPFKVNYVDLKGDPGIASHLRFSDDGIPMIFMIPNVIAPRHYIAEAAEFVFPLFLGIDTSMDANNELIAEWKIRLYDDANYTKI